MENNDPKTKLESSMSLKNTFSTSSFFIEQEGDNWETMSLAGGKPKTSKPKLDLCNFNREFFKARNQRMLDQRKRKEKNTDEQLVENKSEILNKTDLIFRNKRKNTDIDYECKVSDISKPEFENTEMDNLKMQIDIQEKFYNFNLIQRRCGYTLMYGSVINIIYLTVFFFILSLSFTLNSLVHHNIVFKDSSLSLGNKYFICVIFALCLLF